MSLYSLIRYKYVITLFHANQCANLGLDWNLLSTLQQNEMFDLVQVCALMKLPNGNAQGLSCISLFLCQFEGIASCFTFLLFLFFLSKFFSFRFSLLLFMQVGEFETIIII